MVDTEGAKLYRGYYDNIQQPELKEIFSIFHANLNDLFSFMNDKKSGNKHYNAVQSRQLLEINRQLNLIYVTFRDEYSNFSFELNENYQAILEHCKSFLSSSRGSTIPVDFPEIEIIEHKPIFRLSEMIDVQNPEAKRSVQKKFIGGGSYAKVYKYKDPYYDSHFALKKADAHLRTDELERFKNEYQDLKNLDSPYIIRVFHYNESDAEYTMELADYTLEKYIRKYNNNLSFNDRRALVIQLLNAFEYIHSKNLFHRDISYQNVLVNCYDDGSSWIKICDFGLVKRLESTLTRKDTEIKGTLNDISDLKRVGFRNYEIRHETYALAQVVYFTLTGRRTKYDSEKNNELKDFILKAMSSNKNERFPSVAEMKDELTQVVLPSIRKQVDSATS